MNNGYVERERMIVNNGYVVVEKSSAKYEQRFVENPTLEPIKMATSWKSMKDRLCVCNNLSPNDVSVALRSARNYHTDGRIKEVCFPPFMREKYFLKEAEYNLKQAAEVRAYIGEFSKALEDVDPKDL
ncbi:unnamed protein product [Linum trigynum]|uniref:Uncharacterized protein n=1 Tax=Linum trigynum TaxID=586398 RepID=A0AAV2F2M5_9ROSI